MTRKITVFDLKLIEYKKAYSIQREIYDLCYHGDLLDAVLFQENKPTITIGRSGSGENLLVDEELLKKSNINVIHVDRGGDITYHGPGQCVISLVLHLKEYTDNIHGYLRKLEEVIILLLSNYGILAHRITNLSGVWVGNQKIASIGISVEHGITRHGIAINVDPDLSHFDLITACGIKGVKMTSIKNETNKDISMDQVKEEFLTIFSKLFNVEFVYTDYKKGLINYENRSEST